QGIVSRRVAALGAQVTRIEASPRLGEAATRRSADEPPASPGRVEYLVGDARELGGLGLNGFDAAARVMALGNIDPLEPVFRGIAGSLRPGGALVLVISHPAFRAPGQTSWGWDDAGGRQYRRVDGYLSPGQAPIEMHPGRKARGQGGAVTL